MGYPHNPKILEIPDADVSEPDTDSDSDVDFLAIDGGNDNSMESSGDIDKQQPVLIAEEQGPSTGTSSKCKQTNKGSKDRNSYTWKDTPKKRPVAVPFSGENLTFDNDVMEPIQYFSTYFTHEMIDLIRTQSTLFASQNRTVLNTNVAEVCKLLGILIKMGIIDLPRYMMYWSKDFRVNSVADIIGRNRFQTLLMYLHFADNSQIVTARDDPAYDPLAKIHPLLDMLQEQCIKLTAEQEQCVDDQVIKFKGRHSLKQYIPNKPTKRGFKVFFLEIVLMVLCMTSFCMMESLSQFLNLLDLKLGMW